VYEVEFGRVTVPDAGLTDTAMSRAGTTTVTAAVCLTAAGPGDRDRIAAGRGVPDGHQQLGGAGDADDGRVTARCRPRRAAR
jgi:hypothetical protein